MQWKITNLSDFEFSRYFQKKFTNRTQLFRCPLKIHVNDRHRKNCAIFVGFFWPANDTHSIS